MHQAAWLVKHVCAPWEKILFTTFTKNLAMDIASNLKKLCSREEWERIEVVHLDAWSKRFLDKQGFSLKLTYEDPKSEEFWQKALELVAHNLPYPAEFIRGEWDNVLQAHGIETPEGYL